MNILFMGTPLFAVPILQSLMQAGHAIVAVVTQPDRPQGRGMKLHMPPVKEAALELGIEAIFQPERLRGSAELKEILGLPVDFVVTAAYGQLLPKTLLNHPRFAALNVHASLLPSYRGAAPLHHALIDGAAVSGVTIMHMVPRLDAGDIVMQCACEISKDMNFATLHDAIALQGSQLLCKAIDTIVSGEASRTTQDESLVSYAPSLKTSDQILDWNQTATQLCNRIRAFDPQAGTTTYFGEKQLKIWRGQPVGEAEYSSALLLWQQTHEGENQNAELIPGTVLQFTAEGIVVATGSGGLLVQDVQPAGKKRMTAVAWLQGRPLHLGARFSPTPTHNYISE